MQASGGGRTENQINASGTLGEAPELRTRTRFEFGSFGPDVVLS